MVVPLPKARRSWATTSPFGGGPKTTPIAFDRLSLVGQIGDTAGVFRTLTAKSVKEVRPGVFVYDLGQNIVGVPRIRLANGRAGAEGHARYAEMLYPDLPESGEQRRHDHDGELPRRAEPGRLHD